MELEKKISIHLTFCKHSQSSQKKNPYPEISDSFKTEHQQLCPTNVGSLIKNCFFKQLPTLMLELGTFIPAFKPQDGQFHRVDICSDARRVSDSNSGYSQTQSQPFQPNSNLQSSLRGPKNCRPPKYEKLIQKDMPVPQKQTTYQFKTVESDFNPTKSLQITNCVKKVSNRANLKQQDMVTLPK